MGQNDPKGQGSQEELDAGAKYPATQDKGRVVALGHMWPGGQGVQTAEPIALVYVPIAQGCREKEKIYNYDTV